MDHPNSDTFREFLRDNLEPSAAGQVENHLDHCANCRSTVEGLIDNTFPVLVASDRQKQQGSSATKNRLVLTAGGLPEFKLGSKFLIVGELARGGMGIVYRGFDREMKREVAIKVLKGNDQNTHFAARFYREAQISGQLQHPGIIPVYELGQLADDRPFIALKLVEGQTLSAAIHSGALNLTEQLKAFGDISQTMAFAHSMEFIHRDLKPENIMVGRFGEMQVMDWGLAKKLDNVQRPTVSSQVDETNVRLIKPDATQHGDVIGTPAYIPPEQARGDQADKRTDVFALGGILCEIITGQPPFNAPTATAALQKSLEHDLQSTFERLDKSEADESLIQIVKSCLAAAPKDRPADAEIVNQQFSEYLADREKQFETARLEKARTDERLIAQQKRTRQIAWFSTAIVASLFAFAVAGYSYLTEKNQRKSEQVLVEFENLKRQGDNENQIRVNLVSAKAFSDLARSSDSNARPEHWKSALLEIKHANSRSENLVSDSLKEELETVASKIQKESSLFFTQKNRRDQEFSCREKVRQACYRSLYPPELRKALIERLSDEFAEAYREIGITPGELSEEAAERISKSPYQGFLLHGLLFWRIELARESRRYGPRDDDDSRREWLASLMTMAEKDPFRIKIRTALRERKYEQLGPLMKSNDSTGSFATVLLCTPLVEYLEKAEDRVDYLLRAQEAFPDEFQIKWKMSAVNGLDSEEKKELGFRSALACYSLQPDNPAVLMNLGATYVQQKNYAQAIGMLKQLVQIAPSFTNAKYNLANAYWQDQQFDTAMDVCKEILNDSENHYWAILLKAAIHEKQGDIDAAIADFKNAASQNIKHVVPHYRLFEIFRDRKETQESVKHLKNALAIRPKDTAFLKELAKSYRSMKQWDSAEETYKSILAFKPKDSRTIASLAKLYTKDRRPEEAENLLRDSIFNGTNSHQIQLELAKTLLAQQDNDGDGSLKRDEAIKILQKLKAFVPDMKAVQTILQKVGVLE